MTPDFLTACATDIAHLQVDHPVLADALSRAQAVLTEGRLFPEDDGHTATVLGTDGTAYAVNGTCTCPATVHHPEVPCKHRLAYRVYQRVAAQETPAPAPMPAALALKPEWLVEIHGVACIRYVGLRQMAEERGLVSLTAQWTFNDEGLSLATATATFADGRTFTECGDSTPQNAARVGLHWRRLSLTRAKARALRDALAIRECSAEEMD